jgi:hypothetical protein
MRLISFAAAISLAIMPVAALAQQSPGTTGDTIGHPPPLPGPPPLQEPSATQPGPANAKPAATQPTSKGYTGAYAPSNTPANPYSTGPLLQSSGGPGLNVTDSDGVSTRTVKAVPCSASARETDGFTTCVGIPERQDRDLRRRRRSN